MSSLTSALNWYHKKIGAYDKELWEKSVDRRILQGVCAIPRKTARVKTELIDVDLVRGSAFAKAKPQHSWITATISGIRRVLFLPYFYSWWKLQTCFLVSSSLIALYFLQIFALCLYFCADEKAFVDVSVSEVLMPVAMAFILGIVHSQIVDTFTNKKVHKHISGDKRKKSKFKHQRNILNPQHNCKSSPNSASEDKIEMHITNTTKQAAKVNFNNYVVDWLKTSNFNQCHTSECKKLSKSESKLKVSIEDNTKFNSSHTESGVEEFFQPPQHSDKIHVTNTCHEKQACSKLLENSKTNMNEGVQIFSSNSMNSNLIPDELQQLSYNISPVISESSPVHQDSKHLTKIPAENRLPDNVSSDEEFFIARNPTHKANLPSKFSPNHLLTKRRFTKSSTRRHSDCNVYQMPTPKCVTPVFFSLQDHKNAAVMNEEDFMSGPVSSSGDEVTNAAAKRHRFRSRKRQYNDKMYLDNMPLSMHNPAALFTQCSSCEYLDNMPLSMQNPAALFTQRSSCESGFNTPSKPRTSDLEEWPLMTNTDCNSDSTDCPEENESEMSPTENPFAWEIQDPSSNLFNVEYTGVGKGSPSKTVSCTLWEHNECKKADLTALDISSVIIQKVDALQHSSEYLYIGVFFAVMSALLPLLFRLMNCLSECILQDVANEVMSMAVPTSEKVIKMTDDLLGADWSVKVVVTIVLIGRVTLSMAYFFLLCVAEKTFKQRFLYAKHFCFLTSSRRAKRSDLPHFRLNKVRNIKTWLSIRSYMKKLGPQRSVDVIVSIAFILEVCVVSLLCIQLLKESGQFSDMLHCWELLFWTLALGIFLLRFMVIGTKINKKYRNLSVLITEQINLYLHMEQKPHKKEELILANNVLKLAAELIKELESPFKISGLSANSYLYNITKVVVLSAFSAVLTDVLGFKLKLYKIKIK